MTEFEVWKATTQYLESVGFEIIAACPPGGSTFLSGRCCFTHPHSKKRDEPDVMARRGREVLLVECKPTFAGLKNANLKDSGESDMDKLLRLGRDLRLGDYDEQLEKNYGIDASECKFLLYVAFASKIARALDSELGALRVDRPNPRGVPEVVECTPYL